MAWGQERKLEMLRLSDLRPADKNPRTHSAKQVKQIADSIRRFGFTNPILISDDAEIVAGHGRYAAARVLGLVEAPCIRLSKMTPAEKRAYVIADNKLALNAGWDLEILSQDLSVLMDEGFEMELTGFGMVEIDQIMIDAAEAAPARAGPEDDIPEAPSPSETVSKLGDIWLLGRHKLLCGDAKDSLRLADLMGGELAHMVFTDPPYNVPIVGHVSGLGRVRHREFAEAAGEMTPEEFTRFLVETLGPAATFCRDGAIAFVCMDWRHLGEVLSAGKQVFTELKNICVWSKTNGGMGTFYRSQHEMILVWKVGEKPHTNTFGLGDMGRYRTNVWTYAGVNTFKADRHEELASHPTVKPAALVADAIRDVSHRGEVVLDVFGGSGTTLIAAEKTGRIARLVEIDPAYCDVIVRRWSALTGKEATLDGTGLGFEAVSDDRRHGLAGPAAWGA